MKFRDSILALVLVASAVSASLANAEVVGTPAAPPAAPVQLFGMYYTAAQYQPVSGDIDAWNLARLGVRLSKNFNISYNQIMLNDYRTRANAGFNFRVDDGFIRTKWNRIAGNDELSLGLEQHYMIPVSETSRRKTMFTSFRNRLLLDYKPTSTFNITFEESPILFLHRDNGTTSLSGVGAANELFRNWFVVTPTFSLLDEKLKVYLPLWVQNSRFRTFDADTSRSGAWKHSIFLWPEIVYTFNSNFELGIMTMTGSLVASDFSGLTLDSAFRNLVTAVEVILYL